MQTHGCIQRGCSGGSWPVRFLFDAKCWAAGSQVGWQAQVEAIHAKHSVCLFGDFCPSTIWGVAEVQTELQNRATEQRLSRPVLDYRDSCQENEILSTKMFFFSNLLSRNIKPTSTWKQLFESEWVRILEEDCQNANADIIGFKCGCGS